MTITANNILRYRFQHYQQHALGKNSKTIDELLSALTEFEEFTGGKSFARLDGDDIVAFKEHIASRRSKTSQKLLSATTIVHKLAHLLTFFTWLMDQSDGRGLKKSVVECFNPDLRTRTAARTSKPRAWAALSIWSDVLLAAPAQTRLERRNRAIVALLMLTITRDAALISLRLKHLNLSEDRLIQDGTEVDTKFGKTMTTAFFPVGDLPREVIRQWSDELAEMAAGPEDPIFPMDVGDIALLRRKQGDLFEHWRSTAPVRRIVRSAFEAAGHTYVVPHSVRNTITHNGIERNMNMKQQVAWSHNMGHNSVQTTFGHYGRPSAEEVSAVMRELAEEDKYGIRERLHRGIDNLPLEKKELVLKLVESLAH